MDRWLNISKAAISPVKRVKKLFDILSGFQFRYKNFYITNDNTIVVNENAEIIEAVNTSSVIKQPMSNNNLSSVELELKNLEKDLRFAKRYIKIFNEVLNEDEKMIAINFYFKMNSSEKIKSMPKWKYYQIINGINEKLILAWRLFYCNNEGIVNSYDDIEDMVIESRKLLEDIDL